MGHFGTKWARRIKWVRGCFSLARLRAESRLHVSKGRFRAELGLSVPGVAPVIGPLLRAHSLQSRMAM